MCWETEYLYTLSHILYHLNHVLEGLALIMLSCRGSRCAEVVIERAGGDEGKYKISTPEQVVVVKRKSSKRFVRSYKSSSVP